MKLMRQSSWLFINVLITCTLYISNSADTSSSSHAYTMNTSPSTSDIHHHWGNKANELINHNDYNCCSSHYMLSEEEYQLINQLRYLIQSKYDSSDASQLWLLHTATDTDLLRFIRSRHHSIHAAYSMLLAHSKWRSLSLGQKVTPYDNAFTERLKSLIYWTGISSDYTAVLIVSANSFSLASSDCDKFLRYI
jgi:hypothetical protein